MSKVVVLAGRPNTGKTTLFNALTGLRQRVANFSGTTVEKAIGTVVFESSHTELVDLPGTSSILPATGDEYVAFDYLNELALSGKDFLVLCVAEASNLESDLALAVALKDCGYPVSLIVNMIDEAVINGIRIDAERLQAELGMKVVLSSGRTGQGLKRMEGLIARMEGAAEASKAVNIRHGDRKKIRHIQERAIRHARSSARGACSRPEAGILPTISKTLAFDGWLFHPVAGPLILATILLLVFEALFTWASPLRDAISTGLAWAAQTARPAIPGQLLASLVCDGILPGISAVAQFLPQIAILFALIGILEQSGYLPRAGVMVDRALRPFGLDGKVFIPFLSSFACAIPGVMATRTIANEKRRLTAVFLSPLMTCSARIPVYTLIIGAFVPETAKVLGLGAQGLVMGGMYLFGVVMALGVALILKRTSLHEAAPSPVTVLPPYRFPRPKELGRYVWIRCGHFITKAGKIIFLVSLFLWFMGSFPRTTPPSIEMSFLGRAGKLIEPVFRPLGCDWRLAVGVIASIAAREVFVGTLGTIFALNAGAPEGLIVALRRAYTPATGVSLLIFFAVAMQCISTIAVVRRETGGWKWPAIQFATFFALAYTLAIAGFRLTTYFSAL